MTGGSSGVTLPGYVNLTGPMASGKTDTATNSGFFAPLGYITMQVSGNPVKIPYFATWYQFQVRYYNKDNTNFSSVIIKTW